MGQPHVQGEPDVSQDSKWVDELEPHGLIFSLFFALASSLPGLDSSISDMYKQQLQV